MISVKACFYADGRYEYVLAREYIHGCGGSHGNSCIQGIQLEMLSASTNYLLLVSGYACRALH